ncbi:hypothetical protein L3Q82_007768 [Scortum barcoo]|uniref:Uncharacterized protein n=1 Tax=Scortum barcoo TaxID=214431 RepID=A0ACB8WP19_9TELE|nr:hypothetical protein L3Q82_007768 [Scortum barcoo]
MPPGRLPREVFQACPTGRRPRGRPRTRWRDYVSRLAWERLGIPPEELEEVSGVREVWASLLRLLPPRPGPWTKGMKMDGWMDGKKKKPEEEPQMRDPSPWDGQTSFMIVTMQHGNGQD